MWALAKSLLLLARYFRRIALALESIKDLYKLDLQSRGVVQVTPGLKDEVEISYGPKTPADPRAEEEW